MQRTDQRETNLSCFHHRGTGKGAGALLWGGRVPWDQVKLDEGAGVSRGKESLNTYVCIHCSNKKLTISDVLVFYGRTTNYHESSILK